MHSKISKSNNKAKSMKMSKSVLLASAILGGAVADDDFTLLTPEGSDGNAMFNPSTAFTNWLNNSNLTWNGNLTMSDGSSKSARIAYSSGGAAGDVTSEGLRKF